MSPKKTRIITEQVKDRHTSHWDLDMLSRDELEKLMAEGVDVEAAAQAKNTSADDDDEEDESP